MVSGELLKTAGVSETKKPIRVVREFLESVAFWVITKVLNVNGHDGNIAPIEIAARDFKVSHPDFGLAVLDAWRVGHSGQPIALGYFRSLGWPWSRRRRRDVHRPIHFSALVRYDPRERRPARNGWQREASLELSGIDPPRR